MSESLLATLALLALAAVFAPVLSAGVARWFVLPAVVLEIGFGIILGPQVTGWAIEDDVISALSQIGLAFLIFLAGYEIDLERVTGSPLKLAIAGWFISLAVAFAAMFLLRGVGMRSLVVGLCLTTTALGTLLPIVRDANLLPTPFGTRIMAIGAIGEFAPIVAMSLLLTTDAPLHTTVLLIVFAAVALGAAFVAQRPRHPRIRSLMQGTLRTSAQLAVRSVILIIMALLWLAAAFGLDILLGAFAAGIVVRLATSTVDEHTVTSVETKLEAVGFGFLVPIFFIVSGMNFDLRSLTLGKTLLFLVLLLLVRGLPTLLLHRRDLPMPDRGALALMAAAGLPLIVVITGIGVDNGSLDSATAASLVAAGALSVLIYPITSLRLLARSSR